MSNVVSGPFGRKDKPASRFNLDAVIEKSEPSATPMAEPTPNVAELEQAYPEDRSGGDCDYIVENQFIIMLVGERIDEMCMYFFRVMEYEPNIPLISDWRDAMHNMGIEDVCREIRVSTSSEWQGKPSYFTALTMEFYERIPAALGIEETEG